MRILTPTFNDGRVCPKDNRRDEITTGAGLPKGTRVLDRKDVKVMRSRKGGKLLKMKIEAKSYWGYDVPKESKAVTRSTTDDLVQEYLAKGGKITHGNDAKAKGV